MAPNAHLASRGQLPPILPRHRQRDELQHQHHLAAGEVKEASLQRGESVGGARYGGECRVKHEGANGGTMAGHDYTHEHERAAGGHGFPFGSVVDEGEQMG
eukprot:55318-Chlamydomonas_euryale.AAC.1